MIALIATQSLGRGLGDYGRDFESAFGTTRWSLPGGAHNLVVLRED
jgi:hypothetical protein